jgi:hypothetical protein
MKYYQRNGKRAIFDSCRKILVPDNPEERVRQEMVNYLVKDVKCPRKYISTEYPLNEVESKSRLRADIVVWHPTHDLNRPVLVMEIKAADQPITDTTIEQALKYQEVLCCPFIGVSNGEQTIFYHIQDDGTLELEDTFTYKDLLKEENLEYVEQTEPIKRLSYTEVTSTKHIKFLLSWVGQNQPVRVALKPAI